MENESKPSMLWWMIPLFLIAWVSCYVIAAFDWCGIGSCQQNAIGEAGRAPSSSISILIIGGLLAAVPLAIVRWSTRLWVRVIVAGAYAVVLACGSIAVLTLTRG